MSILMPHLRRQIFHHLYDWKNRSPRLSYWRQLERTQFFPEERLREIQWERLKAMIAFTWHHNPFYHQRLASAGVDPSNFHQPGDLQNLPLLTKAEIRADPRALLSSGYENTLLQHATTGGSTGKALDLYFTEECSELRNACALRHDRWTGWEPGEPIAACWGNPHLPKTIKEKMKHWLLQPIIFLDTMCVSKNSVLDFVRQWQHIQPTLLFGHAHSLFLLAQELIKLKIDGLHPKGILSTSMMLLPSERALIEQVFHCKVTDRYGCEEVSLIGCECELHQGMHLNIEHLYIEFIKDDGMPANLGEPGRIVVTDLINKAMPLIRYEVEDVGVPSNRKCPCGRGLPLMEHVMGRIADFLIRKDGAKVAGISLIENTLTRFVGLDQMQIIQHELDNFELCIVQGMGFNSQTVSDLTAYFKEQFGENISVRYTYADAIQPEANGKFRFSICRIQ